MFLKSSPTAGQVTRPMQSAGFGCCPSCWDRLNRPPNMDAGSMCRNKDYSFGEIRRSPSSPASSWYLCPQILHLAIWPLWSPSYLVPYWSRTEVDGCEFLTHNKTPSPYREVCSTTRKFTIDISKSTLSKAISTCSAAATRRRHPPHHRLNLGTNREGTTTIRMLDWISSRPWSPRAVVRGR